MYEENENIPESINCICDMCLDEFHSFEKDIDCTENIKNHIAMYDTCSLENRQKYPNLRPLIDLKIKVICNKCLDLIYERYDGYGKIFETFIEAIHIRRRDEKSNN